MADISTGILHNIGNILSSVNVSTQKIKELAESPAIDDFLKASGMLESRMEDIEEFLCNDPKGKKLMEFYLKLGNTFSTLKEQLESNIERLSIKTDMIDEIISDQQNYTGIKTTIEKTEIIPVIEDALKMSMGTDEKLKIRVVREYKGSTSALAQKAKLFHVIANLIKNAIEAMAETPADKRMLKLSIDTADGERLIRITDQGHGIPSDTLDAIFAYGYTTKKGGHGFGLHSCANYMTEMGGRIRAESEGVGKGASFVLCLKP
jgi:C4-dicarboxylate-specific signal transduction histidine kinase